MCDVGCDANILASSSPATKDFLAGAVGGCASVIAGERRPENCRRSLLMPWTLSKINFHLLRSASAGQPLDTIRIRLQHGTFGGLSQTVNSLVATEGVKSLFKGTAYPLLTITLQVCPCPSDADLAFHQKWADMTIDISDYRPQ